MKLLKPIQNQPPAPEAIFAEKYYWLLKWGLHFAQGDQAEAEDMVQDAFVRFVVSESELKDPERIEPLLYTYLRSVHLSHIRRLQRHPVQSLPLVDFDSIHLAIRETPSVDPIEVQDSLRRIVAYLVWRKERAKSASILLLRFFHGYRKHEIMRIGLLSDRVVANGLMLAREELRKHLAVNDQQIHAIGRTPPPILFPKGVAVSYDQFLPELRRSILDARQTPCLSKEELLARYQCLDPKPVECKILAHVVSCERCLDLVSKLHGMPPLSRRSPEETMDGNRRTKFGFRGKGTGEGGLQRVLRVAQLRLSELYDHQPRQLMVAVNGRMIASRDVSSATNKLEVEIGHETKIEFIEIFSEQGVCLLEMPVDSVPPEAPPEMRHSAKLMNGRSVEMVLRFTGIGPFLDVSYSDPSLPLSFISAAEEFEDSEANYDLKIEQRLQKPQKDSGSRPTSGMPQLLDRAQPFRLSFMNPLLATALVLGIASVLCFLLWTRSGPRIAAGTLLNRAEQSDVAVVRSARSEVIYQKIRITTSGHATTERAIYRDPQKKRRPKQQHLSPDDQWLQDKLNLVGVNWDEPLSAANYREWHDRQQLKEDVVTRKGNNLLTLTTSTDEGGQVLKESLTVRESDFHPVDRTIELRDTGTIEIAELNYDVMPWGAVNRDWFEPVSDQSLVDTERADLALAAVLPRILSNSELDGAELSARVVLHQLHADMGEHIQVARSETGIQIQGFVETNERKHELVKGLLQVPHVRPFVWSVQELGSHPRFSSSSSNAVTQAYAVEAQPSALEQYFSEKKINLDQPDVMFRSLFDQAVRVQQAETHLFEVQQRFKDPSQLHVDQQQQLTALSGSYIDAMNKGLEANERSLASVGLGGSDGSDASGQSSSDLPPGTQSEDLNREVSHYQELCRSLIASSTEKTQSAVVISAQLRESSARIRSSIARMRTPVSNAQN
jgi:DNA-directed RNA polymerase specialized sigma24 family protein